MSLLPTGQSLIRSGRKVTESRLHDCLYDCEYTVSSTRDFERDVCRIRNAVNSTACYPAIYNETHRNQCVTNSRPKNDPDMTLIKGPIRGVQIMAFPRPDTFDSRTKKQLAMSTAEYICKYRFKYFASPVAKNTCDSTNLGGISPKIIADVDTAAPVSTSINFKSEIIPPTPPIQTRETQTDYRDSEAQTDPYSPSYFIVPGSDTAELMALKNITWGDGLPAGRLEVDMILEARRRRLLKNKKPTAKMDEIDGVNGEDMHHWEYLLQSSNVEAYDWLYKSKILDENRNKRLLMLANSLSDLRDKHGDLIEERLRILWKRRNRSKEEANEKLRAEQNRDLRKLYHKKNIPFETSLSELSGRVGLSSKTKSNDMPRFPRQSCPADNRLTKYAGGLEKQALNRGTTSRRSGMKYKFERDLEEAYVNIMEKKQMMSDIVMTQTNRSKGLTLMQPRQVTTTTTTENAASQMDMAEKLPEIVVGAHQDDDTELDALLTKLLSDHWEFINKHFEELLTALPTTPVDQSDSQAV